MSKTKRAPNRTATRAPKSVPLDVREADIDDLLEIRDQIDDLIRSWVGGARMAGISWADIGQVLDMTRQGAQQKFARVPEPGPDAAPEQITRWIDQQQHADAMTQQSHRRRLAALLDLARRQETLTLVTE
jgi:hypothetical protein